MGGNGIYFPIANLRKPTLMRNHLEVTINAQAFSIRHTLRGDAFAHSAEGVASALDVNLMLYDIEPHSFYFILFFWDKIY